MKAGARQGKTRCSCILLRYKYQEKMTSLLNKCKEVCLSTTYQKPSFCRSDAFGVANLFLETGSTYLGKDGS